MKAVLATVADEVIRFIQRFLVQVAGAVARLRNHQHIIQPQSLSCWYLYSEEELVVRHIQDDLILRHQDVPAAVSVWTEGGVDVALPDSSSVNVDLHWISGVQRLVKVEDEDVTAEGVDAR